ncbi:MAG: EFR1 family ferrodoxin [Marinilabiliaceae bacterium]|nr:EFR1 family ferrodoxin [Marinilabiliaceae bacterium]
MKSIKIFYFSGTGNAKQISLWFSELAAKKNIDCQLFDIAKTDVKAIDYINPEDFLIFIAPIHGFNYSKLVLDFICRFPKGTNRVALMCTAGGVKIGRFIMPGLAGAAFIFSSAVLRIKKYKITGQIIFDMPTNFISLHPAMSEKSAQFVFEKNHAIVKKHFEKLYASKNDFAALRRIIADIIVGLPSFMYLFWGRYFMSKTLYASHKCNNCNLCIKECPVKAIKIVNQRPFWTIKCESCLKCMNICPASAIEAAHGLVGLVFYLWIAGSAILMGLLPSFFHYRLVEFLTFDVLLFFGLLFLLYRFQHLLLKNRIIAKIISFTSLTKYKFWGRYYCKNVKI